MKQIMSILIKVMIVLLIIQANFIPISNAESYWEEIFSSGDEFLEEGHKQQTDGDTTVIDETKMKRLSDNLYSILFTLGVVASVIIGAVLGIQLMWGSIEQKAKIKELLIPYIIGCIVIFGAFGIWRIVINVGESIFPTPTNSTTYTKEEDGKLYCDNCGDELVNIEQRRAKCSQCGKSVKGI